MLTQISTGHIFDNTDISFVPVNDFVKTAVDQMSTWLRGGKRLSCVSVSNSDLTSVSDVPDPEAQLNAYEFLDVAIQPKPIFISPNEVYSMHRFLLQHSQQLVRRFLK